jgi:antitoxin ParD1/3/4
MRAMSVTLDPQIEARIRTLIETGRYPDANTVVNDALRVLESRDRQIDELRAKIQIGIDEADRGELDEWTPELRARIRQSAHEVALRGETPDPDVVP